MLVNDLKPSHTIQLTSPDGRTATIDFGGAEITYSGDLPASEGAKVFFDAVHRYFRDAIVDSTQRRLLEYANHLTSCRYRGGHDCDCGLEELRAAFATEQGK